ncbi:MAG: type II secretion system F family protein [Ignisphaera sp.]|uniref:Type II secretion system protein GspF domain-containing protein n=3 Tax=Ignisphaera aggregans TaxID=334771 RepID=A0A832AS25_9CREN
MTAKQEDSKASKKLFKKKEEQQTKASRKPARHVRITTRDVFTAFSLTFFESTGRKFARAFELEKAFNRAGLNVHPVKYGAETLSILFFSILFTVVGFLIIVLTTPLTVIQLIIGIVVAITIPLMVLMVRLLYPYMLITMRRVDVENELPFFMAYIATMVRGGYSLEKVIERISQLKVFKAIRREAQRVMTRIKIFGEDPVTALEKVASNHPSSKFRDIMLGYTTTLRSGGDVLHYLEIRTRELFEARATEVRGILNRLMSFLEVYIIFGVIVSVVIFVFFVVSAAISAAQALRTPEQLEGFSIDITTPSLYNFFVLPVMGIAIALAIHINQPRNPVGFGETYTVLLTWIPISIAIFVIALAVTGGMDIFMGRLGTQQVKSAVYATSSALIALSVPPALKYRSLLKGHRGLVKATADLLRDISEVRKTGLSPEKCIILVSSRNYRSLTPVVERSAAALSIGFSLEEALRKALKGVKEWFTIASFRFLTDSIIVGGGSPEVIDTLARFTQVLSELEEETRRRMRSQIFLPYFGAILLSSIPIIILYMLLSIANIPIAKLSPLLLVISLGSIVNSYMMGIIAGKASQTTIAAGFLHATILTTVSTIATLATFMYIGI